MRFGSMNFPVAPILAEIETVAALGMDYIELAMDPPQAHFSQLRVQRGQIRKALKKHGLGLVCHLPTFVHTADLSDGIRKASVREIVSALETAAELEAEKTVLHPGYIGGLARHVVDRVRALAMESLWVICSCAERLAMPVCLENLFPQVSPYVECDDFKPIFREFPRLNFVLDTGHANIGDAGGRRVLALIALFGERLQHVHISDNRGKADDHLPLGSGTVDFNTVVEALTNAGYRDTFTLEIFGQDSETVTRSRNRLAALLTAAGETSATYR